MTTILLSLGMIVLIALPFIFSGNARKKKEQQIKNTLTDLANSLNSTIDQLDIWSGSGIGVNLSTKSLFFTRIFTDLNEKFTINLGDYKKCKLVKILDKEGNIDKISFMLTPKLATAKETELVLFYSEQNPQLNGEIQISEKWSKTISDLLIG